MSTLNVEHLKHENSSSNNVTLDSDGSVAFDTSTLYVDAVNNNVGIGTASPGRPLEVNGSIRFASGGVIEVGGAGGLNTYVAGIEGSGGYWAFATNAGERMRIDDLGRVTTPYQPYAFVRVSGSPSLASTNVAPYDDIIESQNLSWNTTSKGFTVPVTGVYQITAALRVDGFTGNYMFYQIRANGALILSNPHFLGKPTTGAGFGTASVATSAKLIANDFIDFVWAWDNASPLTIYGTQSYVSVALLG